MAEENRESTNIKITPLLGQIRESYGRLVYTHKTHEKEADRQHRFHLRQQWGLIILTALGTGSFLFSILEIIVPQPISTIIISAVAIFTTWISLAATTLKFSEKSEEHRNTASELWDVRESYISLIADFMSGNITEDEARNRRDELQGTLHEIYNGAPRTTSKSYKLAREGLKENEELFFTQDEIDLLLPQVLRILGQGE
ncbi:SLATT domain-containing protein [Rothia sp. P4278]|uniref:SLATT domain-containing protein n=1 Tax=Rothia sp. P4278 TaxID=3402658 RepID=UPI003AEAD2C2